MQFPQCQFQWSDWQHLFQSGVFYNVTYEEFGNGPTYNSYVRGYGLATEDIGINKYFTFGADGRSN